MLIGKLYKASAAPRSLAVWRGVLHQRDSKMRWLIDSNCHKIVNNRTLDGLSALQMENEAGEVYHVSWRVAPSRIPVSSAPAYQAPAGYISGPRDCIVRVTTLLDIV